MAPAARDGSRLSSPTQFGKVRAISRGLRLCSANSAASQVVMTSRSRSHEQRTRRQVSQQDRETISVAINRTLKHPRVRQIHARKTTRLLAA